VSRLKIDHVTVAGPSLARLDEVFGRLGLATEYGGPHNNGVTHMSLLGFDDGSYVELISTLQPGMQAPLWNPHMQENAGPCGWAVEVEDVWAERARLTSRGIPVQGPVFMSRTKPDGTVAEWDVAMVGGGEPGAVLPFLIKDRTPRTERVRPSPSVSGSEIRGVSLVVLAVSDFAARVELFRRVYDLGEPALEEESPYGNRLAYFPDTPVALASADRSSPMLAERLRRVGESPCAYLLGSTDLDETRRRLPIQLVERCCNSRVGWFDERLISGAWLGIIEVDADGRVGRMPPRAVNRWSKA
jgi:Glyoxalase-like domain